jgi:hypothetical protein
LCFEIVANGGRSLFGKRLVQGIAAHAIGVAFDGETQIRVSENDPGEFGEFLARPCTKGGFAGVKQDIGKVHDQSTGGVARDKDQVELCQQFGSQLFAIFYG